MHGKYGWMFHRSSKCEDKQASLIGRTNWKFVTHARSGIASCIVQGILEQQHVNALDVLLQGLCGGICESLKLHEICLKSGRNLWSCAFGDPSIMFTLPARACVDCEACWGCYERSRADQLPALVRTVLEASIGPNALPCLYALGYKLDYELVVARKRGYEKTQYIYQLG